MNAMFVVDESQIPAFFGINELAAILGICKNSAYKIVKSKGFPSARMGSRIIVRKVSFMEWLNSNFCSETIICIRSKHVERTSA